MSELRKTISTPALIAIGAVVHLVGTHWIDVTLPPVVTGWLLGGTLGVATIVYAVAIGPLVQLMLDPFTVPVGERSRPGPLPPVEPVGPDTLAA